MSTVIIDVRSNKEFQEGSYPGAINLPISEFNIAQFNPFLGLNIALVCFSGRRAEKVRAKLLEAGFNNVSLLKNQMFQIIEGSIESSNIWSIDRQFRMILGLLIGLFMVGNYVLNIPYSEIIAFILFAGLMYSAITDNCYLKTFISKLPWNKGFANK